MLSAGSTEVDSTLCFHEATMHILRGVNKPRPDPDPESVSLTVPGSAGVSYGLWLEASYLPLVLEVGEYVCLPAGPPRS